MNLTNLTLSQITTLLALMRDKKLKWNVDTGWDKDDEDLYELLGEEWEKRMDKEDWRGKSPHLKKMRRP